MGPTIRRLREERHLVQKEVKPQRRSVSWFSRVESGALPDVTIIDLLEIARNLSVTPMEILGLAIGDSPTVVVPPLDPETERLARLGRAVLRLVREHETSADPAEDAAYRADVARVAAFLRRDAVYQATRPTEAALLDLAEHLADVRRGR